jgi:hypothetical protein
MLNRVSHPKVRVTSNELTWREDSVSPALNYISPDTRSLFMSKTSEKRMGEIPTLGTRHHGMARPQVTRTGDEGYPPTGDTVRSPGMVRG